AGAGAAPRQSCRRASPGTRQETCPRGERRRRPSASPGRYAGRHIPGCARSGCASFPPTVPPTPASLWSSSVSRRGERGVALVAAAVALALLTVLATGLATTSAVDQHLARNTLAALQADALVRSGVAAAAVVLRETATEDVPDTLRSPWAQASGRQPLGAGRVAVRTR